MKLTSWLFYTMDDSNELTDTENNLWQMFHLYMTMIQNTELFKRISIETDLAKFSIFLIFDPKKLFTLGFTGNLCIWIRSPRWSTKKNYYCWYKKGWWRNFRENSKQTFCVTTATFMCYFMTYLLNYSVAIWKST